MPLTNAGRDFLLGAATGASTPPFDNANAYIGVGDGAAAFDAAHTDLQAAANKFRKGMDTTYPQTVGNVSTFKSTYGGAEANYAWQEWGVFNDPANGGGVMINRVPEYNGTKLPGQTWIFEVTLTLNIGS